MSHTPPNRFLTRLILCSVILCSVILFTAGCGQRATPTAAPTATRLPSAMTSNKLAPTVPPAPLTTVAPRINAKPAQANAQSSTMLSSPPSLSPSTPLTGTATLGHFTIPFPPTWHYLYLSQQEQYAQVATLARENRALAQSLKTFLERGEKEQPWVVGWPQGDDRGVGLLAYITPRPALAMPQYLAVLEQTLAAQEGLIVQQAALNYTLFTAAPVGELRYTLPPIPAADGRLTVVNGYHLVYFAGANDGVLSPPAPLLTLNFIDPQPLSLTAQAAPESALPIIFATIAQSVNITTTILRLD